MVKRRLNKAMTWGILEWLICAAFSIEEIDGLYISAKRARLKMIMSKEGNVLKPTYSNIRKNGIDE